ncbi:MAG: enoyl-ACP reductase [Fibromonadaceae bacterium]|jgi:enoyl-[acyl-carrier protein] reductase I|nr:enoyl-ACP reductase [Fibromonadaceae bacterium]
MKGKKGIIFGVANDRSIAWGIAKKLLDDGAEVAFSYNGERLKRNLEKLLQDYPGCKLYDCDVSNEENISTVAQQYKADVGKCDFLVHAVGFADRTYLEGQFLPTPKDAFMQAMDVSAYSLVSLTRAFKPLMSSGSSVLALTYLGSEKVVQNYNVMGVAKAALEAMVRYLAYDLGPEGIRVNAISAGPVNTLAARGISDFTDLLKIHRKIAPLRENTTPEHVGGAAYFLLSDLSCGVTSEIMYVDGGYNTVTVGPISAYDKE